MKVEHVVFINAVRLPDYEVVTMLAPGMLEHHEKAYKITYDRVDGLCFIKGISHKSNGWTAIVPNGNIQTMVTYDDTRRPQLVEGGNTATKRTTLDGSPKRHIRSKK